MQAVAPELTMAPLRPARAAEDSDLSLVQSTEGYGLGSIMVCHRRERVAECVRDSGAGLDLLDELDLGTVQMSDDRHVGPPASDDVVLWRQVMKVEHVRTGCPGGGERFVPH